jgi:hypothetical protein
MVPVAVLGLLLLPVQARAGDKDDEALKQMQAAKLTLKKAVETAETACKGKAVAAYAKVEGTKAELLVFCEVDGKCKEVPVDVKAGTAGEATDATAKEEKGAHVTKAKEIAKQLTDAKLTLVKLIDAAETSANAKGKAVSIRPKAEGGRFDFTLRVKAGDKWQNVAVDGKTGTVKAGEDKKAEKKPEQKTPPPAGKGGAGGKGGAPGGGGKGGKGGKGG